ncbi:Killer toxin subunits alpha/beta [Fusarium oxysporum f. sp. albedinis]|nr:Killer toxin subunits alpha/beta [Fusarium oxysporum f. sp. albedinis]
MGTCRISQAIMRRIAHMWRPRNSLSLHYMQSNTIHHYTHMHFQVPPRTWAGAASESIDASNDLIIVCRPSASGAWTTFPRVESIGILYNQELWINSSPNIQTIWRDDQAIDRLLSAFPRLRVLYILVKPENTIEPMIGPPEFTDCMMDYHWYYKQTVVRVPPKTFHARQRIYYELPKAITKSMSRLRRNTELPRLAVRVMTWKDARGVRGRFDLG